MTNFAKGLNAEKIAMDSYLAKGYKLAAHRLKTPFGEIDLIAEKEQQLVFIEVKSRPHALDHDVLSNAQQGRIRRAAEYYIGQNEHLYAKFDARFDLAYLKYGSKIEIIENAW